MGASHGSEQAELVRQVLTTLARLGVREVCIAAGARNAPLLTALSDSRGVKCWSFFEERCAGFFALGRILEGEGPVAVVTTSGTAAAELLPAMIEAHYQGLPLIAVTADRPRRYRNTGAPQAIEQVGLFGTYAQASLDWEKGDAPCLEEWDPGRPLHWNVCLEEPLDPVPGIDFASVIPWPESPAATRPSQSLAEGLDPDQPTLVLAGGMSSSEGAQAREWIAASGLPVMAEASANLGEGLDREWLGGETVLRESEVTQVIRIGGVPSWRWWRDLEDRPEIRVAHICRTPWTGLARPENQLRFSWSALDHPAPTLTPARMGRDLEAALRDCLDHHPRSEPAWVRRIADSVSPQGSLFVGNSLPIRELSLVRAPLGAVVRANRGANGIDGLVSTFLGTATGEGEHLLLLGDLSAMYDLAAPWILRQMPEGRRRIVVINNGGGRIFSRVASLAALEEDVRRRIENEHAIGFEGWAAMWGLPHRRVVSVEDWRDLPAGDAVIEVVPDAAESESFWSSWAGV